MKKILVLIVLMCFSIVLIGCSETTTTTLTTTESQTTTTTTTVRESSSTTTQGTVAKEISLSYADWADPEINQMLIDAFMVKYPHIEVSLRKDITGTGGAFTNNLLNAQAAQTLPDVFAIDNVPTGLYNGMIREITEYWDNDPETDLVYDNIADTAVYDGKRYALPSFQFIKGIGMNLTIFDKYNIPIPDKDWTYEEMIAIAREIRLAGKADYVYGIDGLEGVGLDFELIFPTMDAVDVGYNTWDGTQFNFTSQAWIDAFNLELDLIAENVLAAYTEEELAIIGDGWPWVEGYAGMKIEGTYNFGYVESMFNNGFEFGFWPYPGGEAGQFPPTIIDYAVVSSQTDYPEEAYLLAKWMTFGKEGWMLRLDAMHERGDLFIDRFPVSDVPEIWAKIDEYHLTDYIEGLAENVDLLPYAKPDVDKWLPGYKEFWAWVSSEENDYWTKIYNNEVTPEVFASEWETQINTMISTALEEWKNSIDETN
ncbi:MAG: hypothetical protein WC154_02620 [Candidatus Izemoplasmatales bacterium]